MTFFTLVGLAILGVVFVIFGKIFKTLLRFIALGAMFGLLIMAFKGII